MKFLNSINSEQQKNVIDEVIEEVEKDIFRNALRLGLDPENLENTDLSAIDNPYGAQLSESLAKRTDLLAKKSSIS